MIAQEVEAVFPSLVDQGPDETKYLNYGAFNAVLVEAVKELDSEVDSEVQRLREENLELRDRLDQMVERLEALESRLP